MNLVKISDQLKEIKRELSSLKKNSPGIEACGLLINIVDSTLAEISNTNKEQSDKTFSNMINALRLFSYYFNINIEEVFKRAGFVLDIKK
jgi:hypothetical protein